MEQMNGPKRVSLGVSQIDETCNVSPGTKETLDRANGILDECVNSARSILVRIVGGECEPGEKEKTTGCIVEASDSVLVKSQSIFNTLQEILRGI